MTAKSLFWTQRFACTSTLLVTFPGILKKWKDKPLFVLMQATRFPLCVRGLLAEGACLHFQFRSDEAPADSLHKPSQPQLPCRLISLLPLCLFSWKSHLSPKFSLTGTEILAFLKTVLVPHLQFHTRAVFPLLMPSVPVADPTNRTHFCAFVLSSFVDGSFLLVRT